MPFLLLFWEYFKIGLFTIGGGYVMLPMVMQVVEKHGWIASEELLNFVGIAESTPGPFAINLATFIGMQVGKETSLGLFGGFLGAIVATVGVVLPSLVIVIVVTKLLLKFKSNEYVQGVLGRIKPVVLGLILSAIVTVGCAVVLPNLDTENITSQGFDKFSWVSLIIMVALLVLSRVRLGKKKIHPILLILLSAVAGVVVFGVCKVPI
ncbi:MAG: chromate transporter [Clostridia bacterium]|nr:chromate transporter [Clostridia bacterium]